MKNALDKLESRGAAALTDEELVAVLLAETQGDERARSVAESIIAECGGVARKITDVDIRRLRMMSGIGKLRAARLKAAIELGGRVAQESATKHDIITSDTDVVRVMRPTLGALQHEECWVLYLASSGRMLEHMRVSQGGVQTTVVDCRLIIKRALELLATQMVIVHNHPSGSAEPSGQDIALTERIVAAAQLFEIRLLDHVIVAQTEHYSFRGHGLIK
jgi:DNA repair protein RadC